MILLKEFGELGFLDLLQSPFFDPGIQVRYATAPLEAPRLRMGLCIPNAARTGSRDVMPYLHADPG